jgi:hypothetical protein
LAPVKLNSGSLGAEVSPFCQIKVVTEVPKKVMELDKALRFNIFPTKNGS